MREIDVKLSVFDSESFMFYLIKFGEILGKDSLIIASSKDRTMSYSQKTKIVQFVIDTEEELGV